MGPVCSRTVLRVLVRELEFDELVLAEQVAEFRIPFRFSAVQVLLLVPATPLAKEQVDEIEPQHFHLFHPRDKVSNR